MDNIREKLVEQLRWWATECDRTNFGCQASKLLVDAAKYIANNVKVQEWIPVTERLPNVFEGVLAYCPKRRNTYLLYLNARGEWHFFDKTVAGALLDEAVTHWMPLPTPPKGE